MTRSTVLSRTATREGTRTLRWLLPFIAAVLCTVAGVGTATADIPDPPRDDDDEIAGPCLPDKAPGDECELPDGSDGVCQDETQVCGFTGGETIFCHVCEEEGCSIAGVGMSSPPSAGWLALGALALLGLAHRRRRRR